MELLAQKWVFRGYGTAQYKVKQLLNGLKGPLKMLNIKHFSHISSRADQEKRKLIDAQQQSLVSGIMGDDLKMYRDEAYRLLQAKHLYLAQKTKCNFLKHGDKCTKFFHDLIKRNTRKNEILAINDDLGNSITQERFIVDEFIGYYKNLLGTSVNRIIKSERGSRWAENCGRAVG